MRTILADSPPAVTIGDLFDAMEYAGDSYSIHFRVCPARNRGDECRKCLDLDTAAMAAEDRYMAALLDAAAREAVS